MDSRPWCCLVSSPLLSFVPRALQVLRVQPTPDQVTIEAGLHRNSAAVCPACGAASERVHSGYKRVLRDLPWQGRPVTIRVAARRLRCLNSTCERKTFVEPLGDVAAASARRTQRLGDLQRHVALALGGEAGAKLAVRLAMPTSPDTLLRMAAAPLYKDAPPTPRVLGVDDWAWRRGHRYGTILVDLERNEVIELLPDRQAETLATWLRQHPGIEVVARDRAGAYADGVRQGAPDAIQVADRWHMLRSLGEAVRAVVDRHHAEIRQVAKQIAEQAMVARTDVPAAAPASAKATAAERRSQDGYARRQARYEEAARLRAAGVSLKRIAVLLGAERKTVRGWLRAGGAMLWRKPPKVGALAPYLEHLERRWAEGCHNGAQLWRELATLGFTGRPGCVRSWAGRGRKNEPDSASNGRNGTAATGQPPSTRQLARMLMAEASSLPATERTLTSRLLEQVPGLGDGIAVVKRLSTLLRRKRQGSLTEVLDDAVRTPLKEFATNLRRDIAAVQAALDLPWTTSPVEGQISRLKMLKRTMYGRASFGLLRARVLHAA